MQITTQYTNDKMITQKWIRLKGIKHVFISVNMHFDSNGNANDVEYMRVSKKQILQLLKNETHVPSCIRENERDALYIN